MPEPSPKNAPIEASAEPSAVSALMDLTNLTRSEAEKAQSLGWSKDAVASITESHNQWFACLRDACIKELMIPASLSSTAPKGRKETMELLVDLASAVAGSALSLEQFQAEIAASPLGREVFELCPKFAKEWPFLLDRSLELLRGFDRIMKPSVGLKPLGEAGPLAGQTDKQIFCNSDLLPGLIISNMRIWYPHELAHAIQERVIGLPIPHFDILHLRRTFPMLGLDLPKFKLLPGFFLERPLRMGALDVNAEAAGLEIHRLLAKSGTVAFPNLEAADEAYAGGSGQRLKHAVNRRLEEADLILRASAPSVMAGLAALEGLSAFRTGRTGEEDQRFVIQACDATLRRLPASCRGELLTIRAAYTKLFSETISLWKWVQGAADAVDLKTAAC